MTPFRDDLLANKTALITGGGTGLGFAFASAFGAAGAAAVVASRSAEHVEPAAEQLRAGGVDAHAAGYDVRRPEQVQATVAATIARHGTVDMLVNNAAGNFLVRTEELSPNGWKAVRASSWTGPSTARAGRPADDRCWQRRHPEHRRHLRGERRPLRRPLCRHQGGGRLADPNDGHRVGRAWHPCQRPAMERAVPLGRMGTAEEVAEAATYLVSDAASWITGIVLPVDGGARLTRLLFDERAIALSGQPPR